MRKFDWKIILLFSAGWVLLAFFNSAAIYFAQPQRERPIGWKHIFLWQSVVYSWAILTPLIIFFAKRVRFKKQSWFRFIIAQLTAAAVFLYLHAAVYIGFVMIVDPQVNPVRTAAGYVQPGFFELTFNMIRRPSPTDLIMYFFVLSCFYGVDFYRHLQAEKLKSSELKAALANSQLNALKMQIHPHFLFNTLNSISALMHEDVKAADKMVARLGDFLRMTLDNAGDREVSLNQEMDFVRRYLEIESVRFQDRLVVEMNIDPETVTARVPNLILQPIVENAIKHGISRQTEMGSLIISSEHQGETLQLRVEDSGPGLQTPNGNHREDRTGGIGLVNTRARLAHLYGENHKFEIKNAVPHGVIVTLEIPFVTKNGLPEEPNPANLNDEIGN